MLLTGSSQVFSILTEYFRSGGNTTSVVRSPISWDVVEQHSVGVQVIADVNVLLQQVQGRVVESAGNER